MRSVKIMFSLLILGVTFNSCGYNYMSNCYNWHSISSVQSSEILYLDTLESRFNIRVVSGLLNENFSGEYVRVKNDLTLIVDESTITTVSYPVGMDSSKVAIYAVDGSNKANGIDTCNSLSILTEDGKYIDATDCDGLYMFNKNELPDCFNIGYVLEMSSRICQDKFATGRAYNIGLKFKPQIRDESFHYKIKNGYLKGMTGIKLHRCAVE